MILLPTARLGGRYTLSAIKSDGRVRPLCSFNNLVLDRMLSQITLVNTWLDACQVGTSDVAPEATQTALVSPIAATANRISANSAAENVAPWRGYSQITYRFPVGAVTGIIREVGIGETATVGAAVNSRALTPNVYGEAADIELFSDEQLDVQYELSVYAPANDIIGTCLVNGVEVGYTARAALASNAMHWAPYRSGSVASSGQAVRALFATGVGEHIVAHSGGLGAITSVPGGSSANFTSVTNITAGETDHKLTGIASWDLNAANFGAIRSLAFRYAVGTGTGGNSVGAYQVEFDTPIVKTSLDEFRAHIGMSWGRA